MLWAYMWTFLLAFVTLTFQSVYGQCSEATHSPQPKGLILLTVLQEIGIHIFRPIINIAFDILKMPMKVPRRPSHRGGGVPPLSAS